MRSRLDWKTLILTTQQGWMTSTTIQPQKIWPFSQITALRTIPWEWCSRRNFTNVKSGTTSSAKPGNFIINEDKSSGKTLIDIFSSSGSVLGSRLELPPMRDLVWALRIKSWEGKWSSLFWIVSPLRPGIRMLRRCLDGAGKKSEPSEHIIQFSTHLSITCIHLPFLLFPFYSTKS